FFFFQAEDGIRDRNVTGVQTCALPILLTPSIDGNMNLKKEGIADEKIRFVGNIMIDTLFRMRERSAESTVLSDLGLQERGYALEIGRASCREGVEGWGGAGSVGRRRRG